MPVTPVDFASLLCSRLCHDLLSPVGALNNGLELLADETDPAMRARVTELLHESARASAAKLKFFRLAFGAGGGFGELVDVREARAAIEALLADAKRTELGWLIEDDQLPKAAIKVLLNLALIANEALVRGGKLDIGAEVNGEGDAAMVEIVVRIEGPRILLDSGISAVLTGGEAGEPITSRTAAALMVHNIVASGGGRVLVSAGDEPVTVFGATFRAGLPSAE